MKRFHISHQTGRQKEKNTQLYIKVRDYGKHIKTEWNGDYLVTTYEYNDMIYELWDNMELGILSEVIEYERSEYDERKTN